MVMQETAMAGSEGVEGEGRACLRLGEGLPAARGGPAFTLMRKRR